MLALRSASLAIIAGGQGRRLGGVSKGLLLLDGRALIERLLELSPLFSEVFLVADEPGPYARFGLRAVGDQLPGRGAPGGVYSALCASRTEWVVAVGCDMPFVTLAPLGLLLEAAGEKWDAVCFRVGGRLQPLLAAYRASAAPTWARALSGDPSFGEVYSALRTRVLDEEELRRVDPLLQAVRGVNTPEEARALGVEIPGPWAFKARLR